MILRVSQINVRLIGITLSYFIHIQEILEMDMDLTPKLVILFKNQNVFNLKFINSITPLY